MHNVATDFRCQASNKRGTWATRRTWGNWVNVVLIMHRFATDWIHYDVRLIIDVKSVKFDLMCFIASQVVALLFRDKLVLLVTDKGT